MVLLKQNGMKLNKVKNKECDTAGPGIRFFYFTSQCGLNNWEFACNGRLQVTNIQTKVLFIFLLAKVFFLCLKYFQQLVQICLFQSVFASRSTLRTRETSCPFPQREPSLTSCSPAQSSTSLWWTSSAKMDMNRICITLQHSKGVYFTLFFKCMFLKLCFKVEFIWNSFWIKFYFGGFNYTLVLDILYKMSCFIKFFQGLFLSYPLFSPV